MSALLARSAGHLGTEREPELDRRRPDAARRAVDEQPLTGQQERLREEGVVRGRVRLHESAGLQPIHAFRNRKGVALVDDGELGMPTSAEERTHALVGADDLPGTLEPGDVGGRARRRRVAARDLQQVGVVDPGGVDSDQQLPFGGHRIRPLLEHEPAVVDDRRAHLA